MCSSAPTCCTGTRPFGASRRNFGRERFAGADAKERHRFAYIPFSVGPRHCIGENIAMFEMLVHVNAWSRRFRLTRVGNEPDRTRGANQSAAALQSHDDGGTDDERHDRLCCERCLENNRDVDRAVTYIEGENAERRVPYGEVYSRAVGILHHLQAMGAQRGDKMIIFLSNNEQFLDGFWAAVCGGIVPVPLAVGISDEHRHKLLRVARKLGRPLLYTDAKNLERLQGLAAEVGETRAVRRTQGAQLSGRVASPISREPGKAPSLRPVGSRLHSVLLRLDQRTEGRDADARKSDREYRRVRQPSASTTIRT